MDSFLSRNSTRERIDPATENKQRDIELLLEKLAGDDSLMINSTNGGTQKLTVVSNLVRGSDQPCRTCLLSVPSGNTGRIYLTFEDRDALVTDWLVPEDQAIPMPISNLDKLRFYGGTDGDVIYILWRN